MFPRDKYSKIKGAYDFNSYYDGICTSKNIYPLPIVKTNLCQGLIDLNLDIFRYADWEPFCEALSINKNLRYLLFRSSSFKENLIKCRKSSLAQFPSIQAYFANSLGSLLAYSEEIYYLEVIGIHLKEKTFRSVADGLRLNGTLTHLNLDNCNLGEDNFVLLVDSIKSLYCLISLNVSNNNLTSHCGRYIAELFKFQAIQRHNSAWQNSLRQETTTFDQLMGLLRISLNGNINFGDEGCAYLIQGLIDNIWVEAIDLQRCGITTMGANLWIDFIKGSNENKEPDQSTMNLPNKSLIVLDLRRNLNIDRNCLINLTEIIVRNSKQKTPHFRWLNFDGSRQPKPRICTKTIIDNWPGIINVSEKQIARNISTIRRPSSAGSKTSPVVAPSRSHSASGMKPTFKPGGGSIKYQYVGSTFVTPERESICDKRDRMPESVCMKPPTPIKRTKKFPPKNNRRGDAVYKPETRIEQRKMKNNQMGDTMNSTNKSLVNEKMIKIAQELEYVTEKMNSGIVEINIKVLEKLRKTIDNFCQAQIYNGTEEISNPSSIKEIIEIEEDYKRPKRTFTQDQIRTFDIEDQFVSDYDSKLIE